VGFEVELGNDTEIVTTATEGPVEIWSGRLVDIGDRAVGKYDLISLAIVKWGKERLTS
jgi:hypothetical protein